MPLFSNRPPRFIIRLITASKGLTGITTFLENKNRKNVKDDCKKSGLCISVNLTNYVFASLVETCEVLRSKHVQILSRDEVPDVTMHRGIVPQLWGHFLCRQRLQHQAQAAQWKD